MSHVTCISICAQQLLYDHNSCAANSKYVRPSWSETEQIEKEHGFVLKLDTPNSPGLLLITMIPLYIYINIYILHIYIYIISWRVRSIFGQTHHGSTVQHVLRSRSTRNSLKRSDSMCPTSSISLKSIRCWQKCLVFSLVGRWCKANQVFLISSLYILILVTYHIQNQLFRSHFCFAVSMMQLLRISLLCDMGPTTTRSAKHMDTGPNILNTTNK